MTCVFALSDRSTQRGQVEKKGWDIRRNAKIMTGKLAPARHVLSAATRCWEPKPDSPAAQCR